MHIKSTYIIEIAAENTQRLNPIVQVLERSVFVIFCQRRLQIRQTVLPLDLVPGAPSADPRRLLHTQTLIKIPKLINVPVQETCGEFRTCVEHCKQSTGIRIGEISLNY